MKIQADQKSRLSKWMSPAESVMAETIADHAIEKYIGHLFYNAVEKEGIDRVMEEAFNPRTYDDLEDVFETIESSGIDVADPDAYIASREYLMDKHFDN